MALESKSTLTYLSINKVFLAFILFCLPFFASGNSTPKVTMTHGLAMHGQTKYSADFKHFDYVNENAPKGGKIKQAVISTNFDSFNPFILKGVSAAGVGSYLYDTLTKHAADEAFTEYGLIAERIEMPEDRSWVIFHINPKATFQDGKPIRPEDVVFTFNTLIEKGAPFYKAYYGDVTKVYAMDAHSVKFEFKDNKNKELPLILGQLPVIPEHDWKERDFSKSSLDIPVGSGPYRIKNFEPGRSITWERVKNYWAADLPVNKGFYNFDEIVYEYYGDPTVALEAFKAGEVDFRIENTAKVWATAYTGPKFDKGLIKKEAIKHEMPAGMQAFAFNTRRPVFADRQIRQALAYAFDFEWTNKQLFFDQYTRTDSYFENSELASSGLPTTEELAILQPWINQLPLEVTNQVYQVPSTEKTNKRHNLRQGLKLLKKSGWTIKNKQLVNKQGEQFKFEILLYQKAFERIIHPFIENLNTLGIQADIRLVDTNQYVERLRNFDFDMVIMSIGQSNSPGNEQRNYWSSESADYPGSRNYMGVKDPIVDALVEQVISAPDRESLVNATRALDRVLLWGHYVIPQWHLPKTRVAYWHYLHRPAITPKTGTDLDTWWRSE